MACYPWAIAALREKAALFNSVATLSCFGPHLLSRNTVCIPECNGRFRDARRHKIRGDSPIPWRGVGSNAISTFVGMPPARMTFEFRCVLLQARRVFLRINICNQPRCSFIFPRRPMATNRVSARSRGQFAVPRTLIATPFGRDEPLSA